MHSTEFLYEARSISGGELTYLQLSYTFNHQEYNQYAYGTDYYDKLLSFADFYDYKYGYGNNYLIKLTFYSGGAWATKLGVTISQDPEIIYDYPCYLRGTMLTTPTIATVRCDLYYSEPDPYIEIQGIPTTNLK